MGYISQKNIFYNKIREIGGEWNDTKERPILCLLKFSESDSIYWAIPMGNWSHRSPAAQQRIKKFMAYKNSDIRSCFYHIGKTDVTSIFFISDAIPITEEYIERSYFGRYSQQHYIIKNNQLLSELKRKLRRILSWESANHNYFRQHITDIKEYLENNSQK